MRPFLAFAPLLFATTASASTIFVSSTGDSGPNTLRSAILGANTNPGTDTIVFGFPPALLPVTIVLSSALPDITEAVTMDGYQAGTSPNTLPLSGGTNAVLGIEINGAAVTSVPCMTISGSGVRIQGLVINRCPIGEIEITGSATISGTFI